MSKKSKDYFSLDYVVSMILAIFLPTSLICGIVTRFMEGKIVAGLIRLIFGWNLIWLLDLISMVTRGQIFRLLNL